MLFVLFDTKLPWRFWKKMSETWKKRSSLSWKSSSVFILCDEFSLNITFSSQFFLFCQIALLNFVFCCFLTLNYLDGFGRNCEKGPSLSCRKHSYFLPATQDSSILLQCIPSFSIFVIFERSQRILLSCSQKLRFRM